jgi:hypothetical protein
MLAASVSFYFLVPAVFWFDFYRAQPPHAVQKFGVYRSMSCETSWVGLTYATYGHVYLSCDPGITTGATAERVNAP